MRSWNVSTWRWIALLPVLGVLLAGAQQGRAEDVLLVFAGQSNMEGKGTTNIASKLTDKEKAAIPNVKGFYSNALLDKGKPDPWGLKLYNEKG